MGHDFCRHLVLRASYLITTLKRIVVSGIPFRPHHVVRTDIKREMCAGTIMRVDCQVLIIFPNSEYPLYLGQIPMLSQAVSDAQKWSRRCSTDTRNVITS